MDTIPFLVLGLRGALAWDEDGRRKKRKKSGRFDRVGKVPRRTSQGKEKRAERRKSQAKKENEKVWPRRKGGLC